MYKPTFEVKNKITLKMKVSIIFYSYKMFFKKARVSKIKRFGGYIKHIHFGRELNGPIHINARVSIQIVLYF